MEGRGAPELSPKIMHRFFVEAFPKMFVSSTRDEDLSSESHDYTHHYTVLTARLDNPLLVIHLGHLGPELGLTVRQLRTRVEHSHWSRPVRILCSDWWNFTIRVPRPMP